MSLENVSLQLWMVIFFITIGLILDLVSFSVPHWNAYEGQHWGLWQICDKQGCEAIASQHDISNTMQVGRGLLVLGVVCYVTVSVLIVIHVVQKLTKKEIPWASDHRILTASVFVAFIALFSILLGTVFWSTGSNTTLSWGYYIGYISGLSAAALGGVLIYVRRQELMATIEKTQSVGVV